MVDYTPKIVFENEHYQVEVDGRTSDDDILGRYLIRNKETGVAEAESLMFARSRSYCDQLNEMAFQMKLEESPDDDEKFSDFVDAQMELTGSIPH